MLLLLSYFSFIQTSPGQVSQHLVPKPRISNSKVFNILSKVHMSVVEEQIILTVLTFNRQRVGNKVYLRFVATETKSQKIS